MTRRSLLATLAAPLLPKSAEPLRVGDIITIPINSGVRLGRGLQQKLNWYYSEEIETLEFRVTDVVKAQDDLEFLLAFSGRHS